jgi:uncharacterized membrane protein
VRDRAHFALAGTRLVVAISAGLLVFAVTFVVSPWQVAVLTGWDTMATVFIAWVLWMGYGKDAAATAALATREDDSRAAADVLLVAASVASLVSVAVGLVKATDERGMGEAAITALAVLTVILSWAAVNAVFTLHYARLYYTEQGGIEFNDEAEPDYHDFAYVALTIGMTYQVSDTNLTTKSIRRTAMRHALLSYVFGTFVVAMTINLLAGLLK